MASVEHELWNIFTFYTLHGDPLDPEHLRATQFLKLAKDCNMVGEDSLVSEADIDVCYTAEVCRSTRVGVKKMDYNDFLTALMKVSIKMFPDLPVDDAFQRLLMEHVLPLPSRRCPDAVEVYLDNPDVLTLFKYFGSALTQMFEFYASMSLTKRTRLEGTSPLRVRKINKMKAALGYSEFLKFATDFGLSSSVILSTLELGDIFLSSVKPSTDDKQRKLSLPEFVEALVRCALVAYSKISKAAVLDKIKGLFLYMWRQINKSVPRAFTARLNVSTYHGDLLAGAMLFNKRFTAMWAQDNYRDYLAPEEIPLEPGVKVLRRLMANRPAQLEGALARSLTDGSPSARSARDRGQPSKGQQRYDDVDREAVLAAEAASRAAVEGHVRAGVPRGHPESYETPPPAGASMGATWGLQSGLAGGGGGGGMDDDAEAYYSALGMGRQ